MSGFMCDTSELRMRDGGEDPRAVIATRGFTDGVDRTLFLNYLSGGCQLLIAQQFERGIPSGKVRASRVIGLKCECAIVHVVIKV